MQTARATWILWLGCVWGAACAAEPKLQDTWYLDGERATWVLSFSDGKNFTLRAPDGRRLTSRYVSSSTELGMFYDPEALEDFRHFRYAFDGADLTLTPTAKDRRAAGSLLRELPPANDGEVRRWIREADWKARGGLPGAGGGAADLAALLEQARKDKTFHEQLAAANQSLVEGDYADAQRRFEWAKAVRPDDADVAERLRQSEALALLASGDRLKREGRAEEARRAWLQAVGRWPGLAQAVDERLAGRPGIRARSSRSRLPIRIRLRPRSRRRGPSR
ncbi:MAG: hypothetical protein M5U26_12080 [Planctomycetota bacterium]|nr:hypothetical protein [Planctomycetota bacterium]